MPNCPLKKVSVLSFGKVVRYRFSFDEYALSGEKRNSRHITPINAQNTTAGRYFFKFLKFIGSPHKVTLPVLFKSGNR